MYGEGGNLGFTQLSRVEFALNGGIINTDFIDNSGGVDCSDHEVNLKIILNYKTEYDPLSFDERNKLLSEIENEVRDLVLLDNYYQALVMSYSSLHACDYAELYQDHIHKLESVANLDRKMECLPSDKTIRDRKAVNKGLTKPELAVLLAYTKIYIKEQILKSNLPENPFFKFALESAFPQSLNALYRKQTGAT